MSRHAWINWSYFPVLVESMVPPSRLARRYCQETALRVKLVGLVVRGRKLTETENVHLVV